MSRASVTSNHGDESETAKLVTDEEDDNDGSLKTVNGKSPKSSGGVSPKISTPKFTGKIRINSVTTNGKGLETSKLLDDCDEIVEIGENEIVNERRFVRMSERYTEESNGEKGEVNIELITVDVHRELNDSVECDEKIVTNLKEHSTMNGILENGSFTQEMNGVDELVNGKEIDFDEEELESGTPKHSLTTEACGHCSESDSLGKDEKSSSIDKSSEEEEEEQIETVINGEVSHDETSEITDRGSQTKDFISMQELSFNTSSKPFSESLPKNETSTESQNTASLQSNQNEVKPNEMAAGETSPNQEVSAPSSENSPNHQELPAAPSGENLPHQETGLPPGGGDECQSDVPPNATETTEPVMMQPGVMYGFCPPGLECLLDAGQLVIHKDNLRHKQEFNKDALSRMEIIDETRRLMYYVEEEPTPLSRTSFLFKLHDRNKQEVMEVYMPHSNTCLMCGMSVHCMTRCKFQAMVFAPLSQVAGFIRRSRTRFVQEFEILNHQESVILVMRGGPSDLEIYTPDLENELGRLSVHGWHGIMHEVRRSHDDIGITFPIDLDVRMKAVLIGAVFAIDWLYRTKGGRA